MTSLSFKKATAADKAVIFSWLETPHVREFWDNSQEHKDDIVNFIEGRQQPSNYFNGKFMYWVAYAGSEPFAMLMTYQETTADDIETLKLSHFSQTGHTYSLDYMIGNTAYLGKGYGASTLSEFLDFFRDQVDTKAESFLIDPESDNPRAKHVYEKAGFRYVGDFVMGGHSSGTGKLHHLLVKTFAS